MTFQRLPDHAGFDAKICAKQFFKSVRQGEQTAFRCQLQNPYRASDRKPALDCNPARGPIIYQQLSRFQFTRQRNGLTLPQAQVRARFDFFGKFNRCPSRQRLDPRLHFWRSLEVGKLPRDCGRNHQLPIELRKQPDGLAKNEVLHRTAVCHNQAHCWPNTSARLRRSSSSISRV